MAVSNATNLSNAKDMYEGRSAYKEEFPKTDIQFDSGYKNRLFGRVDTLGNVIQINESFLSFFATSIDKSNVSCIHFVADAFLDCRKQYNIQAAKGNINTASPFFQDTFPVYQGWKKQESLFGTNNNNVYTSFTNYIFNNSYKVSKFENYTQLLLKFLKETDLPLTRVGFYESPFNPPYTSGIVLDVFEGDAGDDSVREQFISNPNYPLVSELLADRGLRFDAQVPWRIIANIQSGNLKPYIQKRLNKSNFVLQDIFDAFYFKSFEGAEFTSFQEFKNTIKAFYNAYKVIFPKYNQFVYRPSPIQQTFAKGAYANTNSCSGVKNVFIYAEDIKLVPDSKEDDLFFLDLYYQTRLLETKIILKDSVQEFHRGNYRGFYLNDKNRQNGIKKAVSYINYNLGTLAFRSPSVDEINLTRTGNTVTM